MPAQSTYAYRARGASGEIISGTTVAASSEEVGAKLRAEGKFVLAIEDNALRAIANLDTAQIRRNEAAKRVRREDVIAFCQQLAVMLETGVPLAEALDAFSTQTPRQEFREVLSVVRDDIHSGGSFSSALAKWPRVFPNMMVSLMKASEASGTLALMLGRVGSYLGKERRTAKQVKGALSYPLFMVSAALAMTIFLMTFVLPKFASIYAKRSATLPKPTKILLAISEFFTNYWMYYGPTIIGAILLVYLWQQKPSGRRTFDWLKLNTPILGPMFRQLYLARMSRTMATLLAAGVNLLDVIDICRGVTNNSYYDDLWEQVEIDIRDGKPFSAPLFDAPIIPANVASMVSAGERSGRLPDVMDRLSEFSEEELDNAIKTSTAFIEPIMIMIMGVMIGGIAMALLLPIFSMGKVVSG